MMWDSTPENIVRFIRGVTVAKREQLVSFFSDAADSYNVSYYIDQLVNRHIFDEDAKGVITLHGAPKLTDVYKRNIIKSLWVVTAFHSNSICELFLLQYPSTVCFITKDNGTFDISVCTVTSDAQAAMLVRKRSIPEGVADEVNHIAIVSDEEVAKQIHNYGFDSYCIIDRSHNPRYGTWE